MQLVYQTVFTRKGHIECSSASFEIRGPDTLNLILSSFVVVLQEVDCAVLSARKQQRSPNKNHPKGVLIATGSPWRPLRKAAGQNYSGTSAAITRVPINNQAK